MVYQNISHSWRVGCLFGSYVAIATKLTHQGDFCAHLNRCLNTNKKHSTFSTFANWISCDFGCQKTYGVSLSRPFVFPLFPHALKPWRCRPVSIPLTDYPRANCQNDTECMVASGSENYLEMAGFHIYLKLLEVLSFRLLVVPLGSPLHR